MANELDFAGDSNPTLLDVLGQTVGQVGQQAGQAAATESMDAQSDTPAPSGPANQDPTVTQAMGPPAPPLVGSAPAMPQTDNTIGQPAGPPSQLSGPMTQPTATGNPASPAALMPDPQAQEVQNDARRGEAEMRNAEALSEKAAREKGQADLDFAKEAEPVFDYETKVAQDKVNAVQAVQNWMTVQQNQIAANTTSDLQRQERLAAENPRDFWGNRSTLGKMQAVVGMLGTAMTGRMASGYVDNLINQDVADYNRRSNALDAIRGIHKEQERQFKSAFHDAGTMIDTMTISRYQQAEKLLQAKRNQSQSSMVQANYDAAIAELRTKIADDVDKLNNTKLKNLAQQQEFAIQRLRIAQNERALAAHGSKPDDGLYFNQTEQTDETQPNSVPKQVGIQTKKVVDETENMLGITSDLRGMVKQLDAGGLSVPEAMSRSAPLRAALSGLARSMTGVGANLTGPEKGVLDDAQITLADYAKGKVTGADMLKKMDVIERVAARKQQTALTENRKGLRLKASSRAGQVLTRDEQATAQEQADTDQIQQALARAPSDIAKKAALTMLAKNGNKRAARMLKESGISGAIRKFFGSYGSSDE